VGRRAQAVLVGVGGRLWNSGFFYLISDREKLLCGKQRSRRKGAKS
jgi:hypothetical protein